MTAAFVFPGQGSQSVGMGRSLADAFASARAVFEEVDDALGEPLSRLMWEGPEDRLRLTENTQPALLAHSLAVMRALEAEHGISVAGHAAFVAGHSLGEYSALAAAGAISLADAARLLRIRGRAMQEAAPPGTGAMAALLGLDFATAAAVAAEAAGPDVCAAANDNDATQIVISGHKAAVERACELAKARGAKRAIMLQVSAPFHCALMAPAAQVMRGALAEVAIRPPTIPVVANVLAAPVSDPDAIRQSLVSQVTGTVRWRECVAAMTKAGVGLFVEAGAGKVLTGLAKRNAPDARAIAVGAPDDLGPAVAALLERG